MSFVRNLVVGGVMAVVLQALPGHAADISQYANQQWLLFSWASWLGPSARGCAPADPTGLWCMIYGPYETPAPAPPWTFTVPSEGGELTVLDASWLVDSFDIYDNGVKIGSTSIPSCVGYSCYNYCSYDPRLCFNDPNASKGVFSMSPGPHSITITPTATSYMAGASYMRLDTFDGSWDADGDGIRDAYDLCPNVAEDFNGVEDKDGCPDAFYDSDGDGIADDVDSCPLAAEDFDGYMDADGCPDPDNDGDGVLDEDDACPASDVRATVIQQDCDSFVTNTVLPDGCALSDRLAMCLNGLRNHGQYVSCVAHVTNDWVKDGVLDNNETGAIKACAAKMK